MATRHARRPARRARPAERRPGRWSERAARGAPRCSSRTSAASYHEIVGADVATTLTDFARSENATQLVLGASGRSRWAELARGSVINDVLHRAQRDRRPRDQHRRRGRRRAGAEPAGRRSLLPTVSRRRQRAGWLVVLVGLPLLTLVLANLRETLSLPSHLLLYLLLVVVAAAVGGVGPAAAAAVARLLVRELVLHPALPPVHDRRRGERPRPRGLPRRRCARQLPRAAGDGARGRGDGPFARRGRGPARGVRTRATGHGGPGGGGPAAGPSRRAAGRAAAGRVPRPAHARWRRSRRRSPASCSATSTGPRRPPSSSSTRSTRRATASTTSSATCST